MNVCLPIVLFLSWFVLVITPTGKLAIEDVKAGVPEDERRGVSIMPGFPLFPLFFWGLAYGIDRFIHPWGSISILVLHIVAFIWAIVVLLRDHFILKGLEAEQSVVKGHKG